VHNHVAVKLHDNQHEYTYHLGSAGIRTKDVQDTSLLPASLLHLAAWDTKVSVPTVFKMRTYAGLLIAHVYSCKYVVRVAYSETQIIYSNTIYISGLQNTEYIQISLW